MQLIASDKQRIIVGLGLTGLSCARYFKALGEHCVLVDNRDSLASLDEIKAEFPDYPIHLGGFDAELFKQADELIVSPGVALEELAIAQAQAEGVAIRGDIDLFREQVNAPIIAITGSNGKSTVTTLVGNMARRAGKRVGVGGNIGVPVLDLLSDDNELFVIELSSFQLERTQHLAAEVAVVLNISADHMDRYSNLQSYHRAKQRVFLGAKKAVVNRGDMLTQPLLSRDMQVSSFGLDQPDLNDFGLLIDEASGVEFLAHGKRLLMPVSEIAIPGRHNIENALAALALGSAMGLDVDSMLAELREFNGLPHRCQRVGTINKVSFFNDSKGTNVGATVAALNGLCDSNAAHKVVLIVGGVGKGADFSPLVDSVKQYCRAVVCFGEASDELFTLLKNDVQAVQADSLHSAVLQASELACDEDLVLFSPACASFDMFDNYQHRGEAFVAEVNALAGGTHD